MNIPVKTIEISDGGLGGTYVLEQFHFHWGTESSEGSEHTVDDKSHPLEVRHRIVKNIPFAICVIDIC